MNKNQKAKVTEYLSDIDLKYIEEITLNTNEVQEVIEDIDVTKIKNKALQHARDTMIQETERLQASTIDRKNNERLFERRNNIRWLIPLVALLSLIGVVAASSFGNSSTIRDLFGELFPYHDQVQIVGTQQIKSGIIYTVEGAFIDSRTGLFIVSMTKEDGSAFKEGTEIQEMWLNMDKPSGKGWTIHSYLEDGGKKLVCVMDLACSEALYGGELTLVAKNIKRRINVTESTNIYLEQLYKEGKFVTLKGNEENWYNYNPQEGMKLMPVETLEIFQVDDIRLTEKGLSILASYPDVEGIMNSWPELYLVDTRIHKKYMPDTHTHWDDAMQLNKKNFVFETITVEDLPYLSVSFTDSYEIMDINENWEVSLKLNKNNQIKSKRIWQYIKGEDNKALFTQVEVSALGVTLRGYGNLDTFQDQKVKVIMKDDTEKILESTGSSTGFKGSVYHFQVHYNPAARIQDMKLINIEDVKAIEINGKVINLS